MAKGLWRSALGRAYLETQMRRWWRFWPSIIAAIANPVLQYKIAERNRLTPLPPLHILFQSICAGVGLYIILTVGEVVIRFIAMPSKIWRENQASIALLTAEPTPEVLARNRHTAALERANSLENQKQVHERMQQGFRERLGDKYKG